MNRLLQGLIVKILGNDSLQRDVASTIADVVKATLPGEIIESEVGDFLVLLGDALGGSDRLVEDFGSD